MQYRRLGSSGLQLSALSFGAWATFGGLVARGEARNLIATAWDHGVNFFDNAETYANGVAEQVMGDVIADLRLPRDGLVVSSKVFFGAVDQPRPTQKGLSRKHVHDACHAALKRLRVDYLDLYYCHRPDPDTPIAETVAAMDGLIRQGKVLYWGTSEWSAAQIREAHEVARAQHLHAPTMEQPQYNLLHRERVEVEYASLYAEFGMGTTIWSPLASGPAQRQVQRRRAGGFAPGAATTTPGCSATCWATTHRGGCRARAPSPHWPRNGACCRRRWRSPGACAIPHVSSVILGATRVAQLQQNLEALEIAQRLGEAEWARVEAVMA